MVIAPALWLAKVGVIAVGLAGTYGWIAWHHYERGYAAHVAVVAEEINDRNREITLLNAKLVHDRLIASAVAMHAINEALAAARAEAPASCSVPLSGWRTSLHPPSAEQPRPSCGLGADTLAKLNRIK